MSFTSQNYGVSKWKRMDRVLVDCLILSMVVTLILGTGVYLFGDHILKVYTSDAHVTECGMQVLFYTTITFFCAASWTCSREPCVGWVTPRRRCFFLLLVPSE